MIYKQLTSEEEVKTVIAHYNKTYPYVVIDTETTGLSRTKDYILSAQITGGLSGVAYFLSAALVPCLRELSIPVVCHNFKFDFHMLLKAGVDCRRLGLFADTLILSHLLDENEEHGLDYLIKKYFADSYKEQFWSKYKTYEEAPFAEAVEYGCKDVLYTDRLLHVLNNDLDVLGVPNTLIQHVNNYALSLYESEVRGLNLDLPYLSKISDTLLNRIDTLLINMRTLVDIECLLIENKMYEKELDKRKSIKGRLAVKRPCFNFDSSSQLSELLYGQLELPCQYNKSKSPTCDDNALSILEPIHPLIPLLREYRGHRKVYTAFIEGSLEKAHNNMIYPTFNPCGTVTGRISSSEPNLQQLPREGGVRGIYVPEKGYRFISADYQQLEVTIAAHFSTDPNLLSIVLEGKSQHDITAAALQIPRHTAKTINFALQYGAGVTKIQRILECTPQQANDAYKRYWDAYRGLYNFTQQCHKTIEEGKPLVNPFGRRRNLPSLESTKNKYPGHWYNKREGALVPRWKGPWESILRQGANSLIQGTGADLTLLAYYLVDTELKAHKIGYALFPIHDEILIAVKDNSVKLGKEILINNMLEVGKMIKLTVPLKVECSDAMDRWED